MAVSTVYIHTHFSESETKIKFTTRHRLFPHSVCANVRHHSALFFIVFDPAFRRSRVYPKYPIILNNNTHLHYYQYLESRKSN